jgi:hypothetical protein
MKIKYYTIRLALAALLAFPFLPSQSVSAFAESELQGCREAFRNLYRAGTVKDAVGFVDHLAKPGIDIAQRGAYIRMVLTGAAFGFSDTPATSAQAEIFKNALFATSSAHLTESQIEASTPKAREANLQAHFYVLAQFEMQGMEAANSNDLNNIQNAFKTHWGVSLPKIVYVFPGLGDDPQLIAMLVGGGLTGLDPKVIKPVNYDKTFPGLKDFAEGLMAHMPNITSYTQAQKLFADNKEQINALTASGLEQLRGEIQAADTLKRNIFIYGESLGALVGSFLIPVLGKPLASGVKATPIGGAYLTMAIPFGLDQGISGDYDLPEQTNCELARNDGIFNYGLYEEFKGKANFGKGAKHIFHSHDEGHSRNGGNLLQKLRAQITKM